MKPSDVGQLKLSTPVWVWIVRVARGRWWPGAVERIETAGGVPNVKVRFETFLRGQTEQPITVGFITVPMRRLERRDVNQKGADRPRFTPSSLLRIPEKPAVGASPPAIRGDSRHSGET